MDYLLNEHEEIDIMEDYNNHVLNLIINGLSSKLIKKEKLVTPRLEF